MSSSKPRHYEIGDMVKGKVAALSSICGRVVGRGTKDGASVLFLENYRWLYEEEAKPLFKAEEGAQKAPKVDFERK